MNSSRHIKDPTRKLKLESLESRQMLDATAQIVDGVLQIFGDHQDERISVIQIGGDIRVSGANINGPGFRVELFSKRDFRAMDIRLGEGQNSISFEMLELDQSITIRGGSSSDSVRFRGSSNLFVKDVPNVTFHGGDGLDLFSSKFSWFKKLHVNLGNGPGFAAIENTTVLKELNLFGQDGSDSFRIVQSELRRFVNIKTGEGGRSLNLNRNLFLGSVSVSTGAKVDNVSRSFAFTENNVGRNVSVVLGDGPDEALIRNNEIGGLLRVVADSSPLGSGDSENEIKVINTDIVGGLFVNGGGGDDHVLLRGASASQLNFRGEGGDDNLTIQRSQFGASKMMMGGGNDTYFAEFSQFGDVALFGQDGDDVLFGFANEIAGASRFVGGAGNDRLFSIQSEFLGPTQFMGHQDDDEITLFANSFLDDVDVLGGTGANGYSAGLGIGEESNFFAAAFNKGSIVDIASPDFRALRASLRS